MTAVLKSQELSVLAQLEKKQQLLARNKELAKAHLLYIQIILSRRPIR